MTIQDQFMMALTAWRENRGGTPQPDAMQSIVNVIMNRAHKRNTDPYSECVRKAQFSSLTSVGDPELTLWPIERDSQWAQWVVAQNIVQNAVSGILEDLTGGADLYYNPASIQTNKTITLPTGATIPFPKTWDPSKVVYSTQIAGHYFFKQI